MEPPVSVVALSRCLQNRDIRCSSLIRHPRRWNWRKERCRKEGFRLQALSFKDYFSGAGAIVNISSTRAFQSQANTESYTAAKGGITALTHALAVSLSGIARVNSIAPGWIDTGSYHEEDYVPAYTEGDIMQHPSQRVGEPADIARAVLFLCDERNSFINGENITIDGGMSKLMIYHNDYGWDYQS